MRPDTILHAIAASSLAGGVLFALPSFAHAESAVPQCGQQWRVIPSTSDDIPANTPAFRLTNWSVGAVRDNPFIQLVERVGDDEAEVPFDVTVEDRRDVLVAPRRAFTEGARVTLRHALCESDVQEYEFLVGPAAALPGAPAQLTMRVFAVTRDGGVERYEAELVLEVSNGTLESWGEQLELSASLAPWSTTHPTRVDANRAYFHAPVECRGRPGIVREGRAMEARGRVEMISGLLLADATASVDIACEGALYVEVLSGGERRLLDERESAAIDPDYFPGEPSTDFDAGVPNPPVADGGHSDGGLDAGAVDPDTVISGPEPSRSCSVQPGAASPAAGLLIALAALVVARRRARG